MLLLLKNNQRQLNILRNLLLSILKTQKFRIIVGVTYVRTNNLKEAIAHLKMQSK
jgi:hypothetical protein